MPAIAATDGITRARPAGAGAGTGTAGTRFSGPLLMVLLLVRVKQVSRSAARRGAPRRFSGSRPPGAFRGLLPVVQMGNLGPRGFVLGRSNPRVSLAAGPLFGFSRHAIVAVKFGHVRGPGRTEEAVDKQ